MTNNPVADLLAVRQKIAQIISEDWADFVGVGPSELATADRILAALTPASAEPVAVCHSFDGYGWQYADQGNGSDWLARALAMPDAQLLYAQAALDKLLAEARLEGWRAGRDAAINVVDELEEYWLHLAKDSHAAERFEDEECYDTKESAAEYIALTIRALPEPKEASHDPH